MRTLRFPSLSHRVQTGFTLVELVVVIVLLSIIAVIGGGFIVNSVDSYQKSMAHSQLVQQARQALERSSRELRHALPNSIRISSNNRCIEWLPVVGIGHYEGQLAGQTISTIATTPITVNLANAHYLSVAALSVEELYGPAANALKPLQSVVAPDSTITSIDFLNSDASFQRDSVSNRVFLLGQAKQLCVVDDRLLLHENYTGAELLPQASLSGAPPNAGVLLAGGVVSSGELPFRLEAGSHVRNSIVILSLPLEQAGQKIVLQHKVMVRNVP